MTVTEILEGLKEDIMRQEEQQPVSNQLGIAYQQMQHKLRMARAVNSYLKFLQATSQYTVFVDFVVNA